MLDDVKLNQIKHYLKGKLITDHWTDSQDAMIKDLLEGYEELIKENKRINELIKQWNHSYYAIKENEELNKKLSEILDIIYTARYDLDHFYALEKTETEHSCKNNQFKKQFEHFKEIIEIIGP